MERRALTILELLIAIVLVASLTALVVPAVLGRLGDFSLDAGARQVEAAFIAARARAQREGLPVAVVARPGAGGVGLFIEAMEAPTEPAGEGFVPADGTAAAWTVLPSRIEVTDAAGDAELERFGPEAEAFPGDSADGAEVAPLLLAVVLPDGTATVEGERYLAGPGGERWRLRVNRWTGAAGFEPVVPGEDLTAEAEAPDGEPGDELSADGWGIGSDEREE